MKSGFRTRAAPVFPKEALRRAQWPPTGMPPGGTWKPFGPWRFNREAQIWQRTYDYVTQDSRVLVTTQRIKHIGKVQDAAVQQDR